MVPMRDQGEAARWPEDDEPPSKLGRVWRRSSALRWTVYLLLIFVVPQTCLWVTVDTINRGKVERKLQAVRDAGDPVTLAEAVPAAVPDEQNAAILYQQVFRVDFENFSHSKDSLLKATGHSELIEREFCKDGSNADQARLVLNDPAVISILETLEEASKRPDCVFAVRWEKGAGALFPHLARLRQAARWLSAKARLCAMDGDPDEALRWLQVVFRTADHAASEPTTIAQLVAFALQRMGLRELERTLSEATPLAEATRDMLDCLESLDVKERFNQSLRGQRAMNLYIYSQLRHPRRGYDWVAESDLLSTEGLIYGYRFGVLRPFYNADRSKYLTATKEAIARSALVPAPPKPPAAPRRQGRFDLGLNLYQVVDLFGTSDREFDKRDTAIMENCIGRVALALTLYEIEHGEYPATLDELQATLDWKLPQDFFAGAPMTYQRQPDGFLLYSFGVDRDDDRGASRDAPGRYAEDCDLVWQLPVPPPPAP